MRGLAVARCGLLVVALGCSSHTHESSGTSNGGASNGGASNGGASNGGVPADGDACSVSHHVEVPLDPFGGLTDPPEIVAFDARFAVLDAEDVTLDKTAAASVVSWSGVDEEDTFTLSELCPDGVCRNIHGTGVLAAAGHAEFILAEQGSSVSMPAYPLRLLAWDSDGSAAAITPLFDSRVTAVTTRADMQSSRDATRALFALGNIDTATLGAVELGVGATLIAPAATVTLPATPWDCLSVVPTDGAGALSVVVKPESGTEVTWFVSEFDDQANVVFTTSVVVPVGDGLGYSECPFVVESPAGFHAEWVSADQAAVIASVERAADPSAPPELLDLDSSPGTLAGVLHDDFLFLATSSDAQPAFVRLTRTGEPSGPSVALPLLPPATPAHHGAPPALLKITGGDVELSYELESTRAFEEQRCP